jgi:hypothetical protein
MEFSIEQIEKQLATLPSAIKRAFFSTETAEHIQDIGERHGLLLDKIDDLIEETGFTLIGLKPAKQFVENITNKLGIKRDVAQKIADEINGEVISEIKKRAREDEEKKYKFVSEEVIAPAQENTNTTQEEISAIEKAGGFSVEQSQPSVAEKESTQEKIEDSAHILNSIENPLSGSEKISRKEHYQPETPHVEPLVDHLLNGTVAQPEQKVVSTPAADPSNIPKQTPPPPSPMKSGPDPYRETFN